VQPALELGAAPFTSYECYKDSIPQKHSPENIADLHPHGDELGVS